MNGILNKLDNGWMLLIDKVIYATDNDKLSIKNCQAIENGYDLDELASEFAYNQSPKDSQESFAKFAFIEGFQKAMEILGAKKFSEEDMIKFSEYCRNTARREGTYGNGFTNDWELCSEQNVVTTKWLFDKHQSLQPNEWEVEIEMICPHPEDTYRCGMEYGCDADGCNHPNKVPYLDKGGCLILKNMKNDT